jgi:broad specificity phosphatase PhoE
MEIGMGGWDGMTHAEIEAECPGAREGLLPGEWFFHSPNGDSYEAFFTRLTAVMDAICADPAAVKIVVAHGVVSRVLRGQHEGLSKSESLGLSVPQDSFHRLCASQLIEHVHC